MKPGDLCMCTHNVDKRLYDPGHCLWQDVKDRQEVALCYEQYTMVLLNKLDNGLVLVMHPKYGPVYIWEHVLKPTKRAHKLKK